MSVILAYNSIECLCLELPLYSVISFRTKNLFSLKLRLGFDCWPNNWRIRGRICTDFRIYAKEAEEEQATS